MRVVAPDPRQRGEERPRRHPRIPTLLLVVLLATGCETATITSAPTTPAGSGGPVTSPPPGESPAGPARTAKPAGPTLRPESLPLPLPTMTEAFAIGEALYDPSRIDDAVVSLIRLLGIGVYKADGTLVRQGDERTDDDPWLLEDEVWGLIDSTIAELVDTAEEPRYRIGDLYDQIQRLLPDLSREAFVAAYTDAYASSPDAIVPQLLLGQPIDGSTPLTRIQLWLLYLDGFVELAEAPATAMYPGALVAGVPSRLGSGTASRFLPPLIQPSTMSQAEWSFLRMHLLSIGFAIWFTLDPPADVHEGHGGPGDTWAIPVEIGPGQPIVSPMSGEVILRPTTGPLDGLAITWKSTDRSVLDAHGTIGAALPSQAFTDASGRAFIEYTTRQEAGDGVGVETNQWAALTASTNLTDLIRRAYVIDDEDIDWVLSTGFLDSEIAATGPGFPIAWHGPGIEIDIRDDYTVELELMPAGMQALVFRTGQDRFKGTLVFHEADQTYRGTIIATSFFTTIMEFTLPLAAGTCGEAGIGELTETTQELYVVAEQEPLTWRAADGPRPSPFVGSDLVLRFYPFFRPIGDIGRCAETIPFFGSPPAGQPLSGRYAPYLDARITTPENGYRIHLPAEGSMTYRDRSQVAPEVGVDSVFTVTVTWVDE